MTDSYRYVAYNYADDWLAIDREAKQMLAFEVESAPGAERACEQLLKVANHYSVIRNFKREEKGLRLLPVWNALQQMQKPYSDEDAKASVEELVNLLRPHYNLKLWSAASKFLWIRFGHPFIIYDSLGWDWMLKHHNTLRPTTWGDFHDCWRSSFQSHQAAVKSACEDLIGIKRFMRANDVSESEWKETLSSLWFRERVFDYFIQTDGPGAASTSKETKGISVQYSI